jgi:hypothetical protein
MRGLGLRVSARILPIACLRVHERDLNTGLRGSLRIPARRIGEQPRYVIWSDSLHGCPVRKGAKPIELDEPSSEEGTNSGIGGRILSSHRRFGGTHVKVPKQLEKASDVLASERQHLKLEFSLV